MESFVDQFVDFIKTHQVWAGPVVGLLAFGESLVLVGILLPGTSVLILVGGLVGAGIVEPIPVLVCAIIGAVLGDIVSYFLGVWLGRRVVYKWPLNQYRDQVARARLFFQRFGFATVFLGRFFGPIRSFVPLVAGMMGMDWRRFQLANVLSAIIWAPLVLSPGWLAAEGTAGFIELGEGELLGIAAVVGILALAASMLVAKFLGRTRMRRRPKPVPRSLPTE